MTGSNQRLARMVACYALPAILAAGAACAADVAPLAHFASGTVIGSYQGGKPGVASFKGIPYAAPPVGARRWQNAVPAASWPEARMADRFGPDCMQSSTMDVLDKPEQDFWYHPPSVTSEDCLYLNIWSPSLKPAGKLPVMVWIHGGGEVQGSGAWPLYDGAALARKGVVLVTVNYRLGIFARFAHPDLIQEDRHHSAGAYDLSDLVQALRWVKENIAAAGGDPENVTIFGQSSGGMYVAALMASPQAAGLFHRAIGQSGGAFRDTLGAQPAAAASSIEFADAIGRPSLQAMRAMPAAELHRAERARRFYLPVVVDGHYLPASPCAVFSRGAQAKVPVLAGFTSEEHYGYKPPPPPFKDIGHFAAFVSQSFAGIGYGAGVAAGFSGLLPATAWSPRRAYQLYRGYGVTGWEMDSWATMMSQAGTEAYLYYFDHAPAGESHAFHTADISYVFNNERHSVRYSPNMKTRPPRRGDLALAEAMSDYWVAFARAGNPAFGAAPAWKGYTGSERSFMAFRDGRAQPGTGFFKHLKFRNICEVAS